MRRTLLVLVCFSLIGCSDESESAAGSGGAAGSSGSAGSGGSAGGGGSGGAGAGGTGGSAGMGGSGGGPVEPPITCTNQCRYVRAGATGAGSGADWNDAFASLPTQLERGLVYLMADGDYGSAAFDTAPSGTELVVVRKATSESHGTETGWQADYGDGVARFTGVSFGSSYWLFEGAKGGGPGAWNSGHGFEIVREGSACKDNGSLIDFAPGVAHVTVAHVHAHGAKYDYPINGVKGTGGNSDLTFRYVSVHTTFGPTFHIGDWKDVVIEKSYLADVRSTGAGDPFCSDWHAEGISSIGTNENVVIRHNLWDRIGGTAVFAGVNTGASKAWKIHGNVFSRSVTTIRYYNEASSTNKQTMDDLEFHGNVILKMPGSSVGVLAIDAGANNRAFNNIWYDNIANTFSFAGVSHDHNYFAENRRVEGCSPVCDKDDEGAAGETQAQVASGSPFVNADVDPLDADLHLKAATQPGKSLPAPFDLDPDGKTRGADGSWDRGAYEFGP